MAFPTSVDTFSTKIDNVNTILAADVNSLQTAVVAIETALLTPPVPNTLGYVTLGQAETITAVKTFSASPIVVSATGWQIDANGNLAVRSITALPVGPYTSRFPAGGTNPVTAGTAGALYDENGAFINIAGPKYRAIGTWDLVAGTGDATAAINQAINDLSALGGVVWFPAGIYRITGTINLKAKSFLWGAGRTISAGGSVIQNNSNSNINMVNVPDGDWGIRGIVFLHNAQGAAGTGHILNLGVVGTNFCSGGLVDNCRFFAAPQACINLNNAGDTQIVNTGFEASNYGIYAAAGVTQATDIRINSECIFYRNQIDIYAGTGSRWKINGEFQQTGSPGYTAGVGYPVWLESGFLGYSEIKGIFDTCGNELRILSGQVNDVQGVFFNGKRHGARLGGSTAFNRIHDSTFYNGAQLVAASDAIFLDGSVDANYVEDNIALAGYRYGVNVSAATVTNTRVFDNGLTSNVSGGLVDAGTNTYIRGNRGYNPVGNVTPAVPATTVARVFGPYDSTAYITAGASTVAISVNGVALLTIAANDTVAIRVPATQSITLTYASAPTWVVMGD